MDFTYKVQKAQVGICIKIIDIQAIINKIIHKTKGLPLVQFQLNNYKNKVLLCDLKRPYARGIAVGTVLSGGTPVLAGGRLGQDFGQDLEYPSLERTWNQSLGYPIKSQTPEKTLPSPSFSFGW